MVLRNLLINENQDQSSFGRMVAARLLKVGANKEVKHAVKFGLVGVSGTLIDFAILNFLVFGLGWNGSLDKLYANIISTSIAIVSNFTWNRLWTFSNARARSSSRQFVQYVIVALAGLVFHSVIFYLANQYIYNPLLPEAWAVQFAKLTAVGIVMFWNFGMNRIWTFQGA